MRIIRTISSIRPLLLNGRRLSNEKKNAIIFEPMACVMMIVFTIMSRYKLVFGIDEI